VTDSRRLAIAVAFAWGLVAFGAMLSQVHGQTLDVPALIVDAAERHGADPVFMLRVARCESGFRPYVVGPWGHVGTFQWEHRSFYEEARWMGLDASPWDAWANVEAAAFAFGQGRAWRWRACW
jgi:hypothetical protein